MAYGIPLGGQRIVVADRASKVTGREIVIPGLRGHPDALPRSPSPYDDEFDGPLSGSWSTFGGITTANANTTIPSHAYLKHAKTSTVTLSGIYRALPPTPFTMVAKCSGENARTSTGGNMEIGVFLGAATPGQTENLFLRDDTSSARGFGIQAWSNLTTPTSTPVTLTSSAGYGYHAPFWMKIVATSTTNVAYYYSFDGRVYVTVATARNPGFTLGSIGFVIYNGAQNTYDCELAWDYMRFTLP